MSRRLLLMQSVVNVFGSKPMSDQELTALSDKLADELESGINAVCANLREKFPDVVIEVEA